MQDVQQIPNNNFPRFASLLFVRATFQQRDQFVPVLFDNESHELLRG